MKYLRSWSKITYTLVLRIDLGGNFIIREKKHFTSGTSTGWGKITSLAALVMLFSPNQLRFPEVKRFSLITQLPPKSILKTSA